MDALVRLRCESSEKETWFAAAGGSREFSSWARRLLNAAAGGGGVPIVSAPAGALTTAMDRLPDDALVEFVSGRTREPVTKRMSAAEAREVQRGSRTPVCEKTRFPVEVCLCPKCKRRQRG